MRRRDIAIRGTPVIPRTLARVSSASWLPIALLTFFAASAVASLLREGATFDETAHLPAGYSYLTQFDYRLTPEHPPLAKLVSAAPLVLAHARMPAASARDGWTRADAWSFGYDFLFRTPGNDANTLLTLGRLPVVAFGVLLAILVYVFSREISGEAGGRIALFCVTFSPAVLAHTRLATTDIPMALFYLATVHATYRVGRDLRPQTVLYLGTSLGLALATKFSALLLLPVVAVLLFWRGVDSQPLVCTLWARQRLLSRRLEKSSAMALTCAVSLACACFVVWSAYGFRYSAHADEGVHLDYRLSAITAEYLTGHPVLELAISLAKTSRVLPESYIDGFAYLAARSGVRSSYLLGERSMQGFALFFPTVFLVKTPIALLLSTVPAIASLLLGGSARAWQRRCLGVPALSYLGISLVAPLNIGERHLLPLYPFLFIAVGSLAPWVDGTRAWLWPQFTLLGAWYMAAWASISPHYLAYFNELVGGPARGDRVLADSNLDWGQDVKALGAWVKAHDVQRMPYAHFGTTRPQYYGIEPFISLPGASIVPRDDRAAEWTLADLSGEDVEYVAIHVTNLRGVYLPDLMTVNGRLENIGKDYYRVFWDVEPVARIGYSINVYHNPWRR